MMTNSDSNIFERFNSGLINIFSKNLRLYETWCLEHSVRFSNWKNDDEYLNNGHYIETVEKEVILLPDSEDFNLKLALLISKETEWINIRDILDYLNIILTWIDAFVSFVNYIIIDQDLIILRKNNSFVIISIPVIKCMKFKGRYIDYDETFKTLKSYDNMISFRGMTDCNKFVINCMSCATIEDLDTYSNRIKLKEKSLLFGTIGIILRNYTEQIKLLEKLWTNNNFSYWEKVNVYKKYGVTILSFILLSDESERLIEWFKTNAKLIKLEIDSHLKYLYQKIFQNCDNQYDVNKGFGSYSNDTDIDNIDDVVLQISTAIMLLVLGGKKCNLQNLFKEIINYTGQMNSSGIIEMLYGRLYSDFNNAGNMVYLLFSNLLNGSFLSQDNYITKDFYNYLWDNLLDCNITFKFAWVFFNVAFRGKNTVELLDCLWQKLERENYIRKMLLIEKVKIDDNEEIKQNWLSVRLCEVASIKNDVRILDWFWKKTKNFPDKNLIRQVALTNGLWAFGKAVGDNNYEIANWLWGKVSKLNQNLLENFLINKEIYQPNLEWIFLKVGKTTDKNADKMLNWIFEKIRDVYGNNINIKNEDLDKTYKYSLLIGFIKAYIFQNDKMVEKFKNEIYKKENIFSMFTELMFYPNESFEFQSFDIEVVPLGNMHCLRIKYDRNLI